METLANAVKLRNVYDFIADDRYTAAKIILDYLEQVIVLERKVNALEAELGAFKHTVDKKDEL